MVDFIKGSIDSGLFYFVKYMQIMRHNFSGKASIVQYS